MQSPRDLRTFIGSGIRNEEDLVSFLLTLAIAGSRANPISRAARTQSQVSRYVAKHHWALRRPQQKRRAKSPA